MFEHFESITFTELKNHNLDVKLTYAKTGQQIAYAVQNELILESLLFENSKLRFVCDYSIDFISWSPDSELICCGMLKQGLIQVWSIENPSWRCRISEGLLQISDIIWAPDSRHLLVICESNMKLTIWSFVSTDFTVIDNPKFSHKGISFSNCSKYLAVLERRNYTDCVGIYSSESWQNLKRFSVDMSNAVEIQFSPLDLVIAVVAAFLEEYKMSFYSIDGRLLKTFSKTNQVLGITSFIWNLKSNSILFVDYFEKISVLSKSTYKEVYNQDLFQAISSTDVNIYRLKENDSNNNISKYEVISERPFSFSSLVSNKKSTSKSPKIGISTIELSCNGQYASVVTNSLPNLIFIFGVKNYSISDVIIHNSKIKSVSWHSEKSILAFCCMCNFVELWTPTCCIRIISPFENSFQIKSVDWGETEEILVLNAKECSAVLKFP